MPNASKSPGILELARAHPVISSAFLILPILGVIGALLWIPEWSTSRKAAAGLVGGLFIAFIITATHVVRILSDEE